MSDARSDRAAPRAADADPTPAPPALDWTPAGAPISAAFGDVYYSDQDGRGETEHVFLAGSGLPERWRGRALFSVGELGFGVGLNLLTLWAAWEADPRRPAALRFASVEAAPPPATAIRRAIGRWPDLAPKAEALLGAGWPPPVGLSERQLGPIRLSLWVGDVATTPEAWARPSDAWFLDGFSPAKNPAMWAEATLRGVAARTVPGGTVATYAAAGWVRRNLTSAGFETRRAPGFGRKREMLTGRLPAP